MAVKLVVLIGVANIDVSAQECTGHKDNAKEPQVRSVIDEIYGFFSKYEIVTQPLNREDITLHTDPTISSSCPQHGKIMLSMDHLLINLKAMGDLPADAKTASAAKKDRVMIAMHPIISHHYAHLQHNKFTLITGMQQTHQEIEYHVDFIAGYLNGRSTWFAEKQKGKVLCIASEESQIQMMKEVFERDKVSMRATFKRLIKAMNDYQKVNQLNHNNKQRYRGLEIERKKAYLNGFMSAINYDILTWKREDDEKLASWVEFFYEPLPAAKKRFSRNLFAFLGEELDVPVDAALLSEPVAPTELMEKGDVYVSNLISLPTLSAMNNDGDNQEE